MIGPVHFIKNKYRRWYFLLIDRASNRASPAGVKGGTERHHVIPKCVGGLDAYRVAFTYREHFLAHWLLTKFTTGDARLKLKRALACMVLSRTGRLLSSWQYERARRAAHEAHVGQKYALGVTRSPETRRKMGEAARNRGPETRAKLSHASRNRSPETRDKLRIAATNLSEEDRAKKRASKLGPKNPMWGKVRSVESRAKQGASITGINNHLWGKKHSPETRAKIGFKSRTRTPETLEKMSRARKEWWARRRADNRTTNQAPAI